MGIIKPEHRTIYSGVHKDKSLSAWADLRTTMLYKETDPLVKTKNTMRKMSFTFFVANASLEEARYNEQNLNLLMCMMYPKRNQEGALVGQGTMLRVKGLGFIDSAVPGQANGVAIYISSLTYSPDIEAGFVTSKATGIFGEDEIYPAKIELSIEGNIRIDTYLTDDLSPIPVNYPSYR
mgnify:CR=1 FL=1